MFTPIKPELRSAKKQQQHRMSDNLEVTDVPYRLYILDRIGFHAIIPTYGGTNKQNNNNYNIRRNKEQTALAKQKQRTNNNFQIKMSYLKKQPPHEVFGACSLDKKKKKTYKGARE